MKEPQQAKYIWSVSLPFFVLGPLHHHHKKYEWLMVWCQYCSPMWKRRTYIIKCIIFTFVIKHTKVAPTQTTNWAASWRKPTKWSVCPARTIISLGIRPVSAQSDQSLWSPHDERLGLWLRIKRIAKTLNRLGRCPGWSESLLDAQITLLVLSWGGSFVSSFTHYVSWYLCKNWLNIV